MRLQIHIAQRSLRIGVTLPERALSCLPRLDFLVLLKQCFCLQKHQELRFCISSLPSFRSRVLALIYLYGRVHNLLNRNGSYLLPEQSPHCERPAGGCSRAVSERNIGRTPPRAHLNRSNVLTNRGKFGGRARSLRSAFTEDPRSATAGPTRQDSTSYQGFPLRGFSSRSLAAIPHRVITCLRPFCRLPRPHSFRPVSRS